MSGVCWVSLVVSWAFRACEGLEYTQVTSRRSQLPHVGCLSSHYAGTHKYVVLAVEGGRE